MRRNDRDNTPRAEDEAFALRLLDGVRRFFLHLSLILENQRILSHASAYDAVEQLLTFSEDG